MGHDILDWKYLGDEKNVASYSLTNLQLQNHLDEELKMLGSLLMQSEQREGERVRKQRYLDFDTGVRYGDVSRYRIR